MHSFQFWKTWPSAYQRLWWICMPLFVVAIAGTLIFLFQYPAPTFTWQQLQELRHQELPIHTFEVGGFDLTVFTDNFILLERWAANPMQVYIQSLDVYLIFFTIAIAVLLSIISVLPRFWFFAGSGAAVFLISSFQLESLQLAGIENKVPTIIVMVLLIGLELYFQFVNKTISFLTRIISFLAAGLLIGFLISTYSIVPQPLRYLAINTLPSSLVILMIFIILVAHEIMASFVSLVGRGMRNSKSLQHYLVISSIYLLNLWFAYWNKIGWLDWGFVVPPLVLLAISSVLALWGIRQRQPQFENILQADPFGVYLMLSLGTLSFATAGYFIASSHDVAMLSINDMILYAHLGYGMMFVIYMASNFLGMLSRNFPVYKVLYKPTIMPYFSYRIAGLIFTLALLFYNRWMVPVNHFASAYYTALGDLSASENNGTLALGYYKRAHFYASYNQHAATALASIESSRDNTLKARNYLADANQYKPTEFTLINAANTFAGNALEEILVLREAQKALPKSYVIANNLGLAYAELGVLDSAYFYYSIARKNNLTEASAEMNLLGLIGEHNLNVNMDSISSLLYSQELRVKSNILASANRQSKQMEISITLPADSTLDLFSATLIGNYLTNHLAQTDTAFLSRCITLARYEKNRAFSETVLVPAAAACYASGQVNRAFQLLQEVIFSGGDKGAHNTTLALWALEQGKPDVAYSYLQFAVNQRAAHAGVANAVIVSETLHINEAIIAWDTLSQRKDSSIKVMSESMKRVLAAPPAWYPDLTQKEKYQHLRYRVSLIDSTQFNRLLSLISDEDLKAKALLDRAEKWFTMDEISRAFNTYQKLQGLHLTDMALFARIKYFELGLFAAKEQWTLLDEQIKKGILFGPYHETEHAYYSGLLMAAAGDTSGAAKNFTWISQQNPYFDEGVIAATSFLQAQGAESSKIYGILSEALQVNPNSVKILKAYIPVARARGYDTYASSALATLQKLVLPSSYNAFVKKLEFSGLSGQ